MRSFFLFLALLILAPAAQASCMQTPDVFIEAPITAVYEPVFDGGGGNLSGCLLESGEKVLGFSTDETLCRSRHGTKAKLRVVAGCCDTGRDFGDASCVARNRPAPGKKFVHGNGKLIRVDDGKRD